MYASFVGREIVLPGGDADVLLPGDENVGAQREVLKIVGQRIFGSAAIASHVVERRVDRHETELAFVKIVAIDPEIVVLGKGQMRRELMRESGVPGVVGFGERDGACRLGWLQRRRGSRESEDAGGNILEVGHWKVSREARMQSRYRRAACRRS